jgi:hypothetical protein
MRRLLVAALVVLLFAVPCLASDRYETVFSGAKPSYYPIVPGPVFDGGRDILWDTGPFESQPGLSVLDTAAGMGTYGFGHQFYYGNLISDEFVIPAGATWEIHDITFFGYQTGSLTSPSTFTAVFVTIYDGPPDNPASNIVWGDISVDIMTTTMWSGVYRVVDYDLTATNRPIMANTCHIGTTLTTGEYWIVWQSDGTLSSGPWAPPITIPGQVGTGNALQYTTTAGVWNPVIDLEPQGFPFIIEGVHPSPVEEATWSSVKAMFR